LERPFFVSEFHGRLSQLFARRQIKFLAGFILFLFLTIFPDVFHKRMIIKAGLQIPLIDVVLRVDAVVEVLDV
jgi:hypothetical protein